MISIRSCLPQRTMYRGVRKLPPATVRVIQPDGILRRHRVLAPEFRRDPARAGWTAKDWQDA